MFLRTLRLKAGHLFFRPHTLILNLSVLPVLVILSSIVDAQKADPKTTVATQGASPSKGTTVASKDKKPTLADQRKFLEAMTSAEKDRSEVQTAVDKANAATKSIKDATTGDSTDDAAAGRINTLTTVFKGLKTDDPHSTLQDAVKRLTATDASLRKAYRPFEGVGFAKVKNPQMGLEQALKDVGGRLDAIKTLRKAVPGADDALKQAMSGVSTSVQAFVDRLTKTLQTLVDAKDDASLLRPVLVKDLSKLTDAIRIRRQFDPAALQKALTDAPEPKATVPPGLTTSLDARIKLGSGRVLTWLVSLGNELTDVNIKSDSLLTKYIKDPARFYVDATVTSKIDYAIADNDTKISAAMHSLIDQYNNTALPAIPDTIRPSASVPKDWNSPLALLETSNTRTGILVDLLQAKPPVDISTWVSEPVSLYYFDDVPRLMQVLNAASVTKGGLPELQAAAENSRTELEKATIALANARQVTNDARRELELRQEALRAGQIDAERKSATAEQEARRARAEATRDQARLRDLERREALAKSDNDLAKTDDTRKKAALDKAVTDSQTASTTADKDPTDKTKAQEARQAKVKLDRAQREYDAAERKVDTTQKQLDVATADVEHAKSQGTADDTTATSTESATTKRLADIQGELTALQGKLDAAETDEKSKNADVRTALGQARLAAIADNTTFAKARDNVPFWYAAPKTSATPVTDPTERIFIYGFPDSKIIFLRGSQTDVELVREMIQKFDRPQAQALMTLWKMEVNSTSSPYGNERASKALKALEEELGIARVQSSESIAVLREVINQVVDEATLIYTARRVELLNNEAPKAVPTPYDSVDAAIDALISEPEVQAIGSRTPPYLALKRYIDSADALWKQQFQALDGTNPNFTKARATLEYKRGVIAYLKNSYVSNAAAFYDDDVLRTVGWREDFIDTLKDTSFFRAILPDCKGTTTLAEALVVLSLGKRNYQRRILALYLPRVNDRIRKYTLSTLTTLAGQSNDHRAESDFKQTAAETERDLAVEHASHLQEILDQANAALRMAEQALDKDPTNVIKQKALADALLTRDMANHERELSALRIDSALRELKTRTAKSSPAGYSLDIRTDFTNLRRFVGENPQAGAGIHSFQKEIIDELQRNAVPAIREYLALLAERRDFYTNENKIFIAQLMTEPMNTALQKQAIEALNESQNLSLRMQAPADWLYDFFGQRTTTTAQRVSHLAPDELRAEIVRLQRSISFNLANARQAALNEMLKEYAQSVDDDIQQQFIGPMFERIRTRMLGSGVQVGVVQRTQILASNRLVARVDPSASAQLAVGQETNVLQAVNQLAQIGLAVQTGGLSTGLGGLEKFTSSQGSLEKIPRDAPPGVYGVTTGDIFQVTPITDPTGQALRFRFDHLSSTQIREPSGTTNPQLPRIDRHGINTEVQLSNQEIRTISRFDTNVQLGIAERRSGGLPILKDIPYIRDIPLIGWFTRTAGQASTVQQSIILGQTEMFPTVSDIIDLLTRPISRQSLPGDVMGDKSP